VDFSSQPFFPSDSSHQLLDPALTDRAGPLSTPADLLRVSRWQLKRLVARHSPADRCPRQVIASPIEPTTLVNEVARQLLGAGGLQDLPNRTDFLADLAIDFRRLIRRRHDQDRPTSVVMTSETTLALGLLALPGNPTVAQVDAAMRAIEAQSPRHAQIAILRLFGGMTSAEIADQMNMSVGRVASGWANAKSWLRRRLVN